MDSMKNEQIPFTFEDFRSAADEEYLYHSNRSEEFENISDGFNFINQKVNVNENEVEQETYFMGVAFSDALQSLMMYAVGFSDEDLLYGQTISIDNYEDENSIKIEVVSVVVYKIKKKEIMFSSKLTLNQEIYENDDALTNQINEIFETVNKEYQFKQQLLVNEFKKILI